MTWYRGSWNDWVGGSLIAPVLAYAAWLSNHLQRPGREPVKITGWESFVGFLQSIPWVDGLSTSLPFGIALIPLVVLAVRWYHAGEPLPEKATTRPYTVHLMGATAIQTVGVGTAYAITGYSEMSGRPLEEIVMAMPSWMISTLTLLLTLGLTVGIIGPAICMYLDARYIGDRSALSLWGVDNMLLWLTIMGGQFTGIPTLIAVYLYLGKRETAQIETEVFA